MNFNSHLDAVVLAAVRLVNVATAGHCEGRVYEPPDRARLADALTEALSTDRDVRAISPSSVGGLLTAAAGLRTVIEAIDADDHDAAAGALNAMLRESGAHPELARHDGEPWHLHFHGASQDQVTGWVAGCATGLAVVLGSEHADRLGVCSAPACDRVFVDISRNGTRRFCGVSCQSRVKTAAYRARAGDRAAAASTGRARLGSTARARPAPG